MPLDDARLRQLGRVAASAAELEYYLYALCCELAGDDVDDARAAVGFRGFADLTKFARVQLAARGLATAKGAQLDSFLDLASDAMKERNRVLHSHWVSDTTQARRRRRQDPGVRLEVPAGDIADVAEMLDTAVSGMNFMWIEVVIALGRLDVVDGQPRLTDWTGLPTSTERRTRTPHAAGRWAHAFLTGVGSLTAEVTAEHWYPDDSEAALPESAPDA